jgi:thiol:disulfide interchange protein
MENGSSCVIIQVKTMKRSFLLLLVLPFLTSGQILTPVKWSFSQVMTSDNNYDLKFKATIDKTWHIYSQYIGDNGPVPTKFTFQPNAEVDFIGKTDEPKGHEEHDPNFDMKLVWFENEVTFTQKVKVTKTTKLKGNVEYMVCAMQCLPPTKEPFEFLLIGKDDVTVATESLSIPGKTAATSASVATTPSLTLNLQNPLQFNNPTNTMNSGILDPVKWDIQGVMAPGSKGKYMITFKATIDHGFHINANKLKEKDLIPTTFSFDSLVGVKLVGEINALSKVLEKKDKLYKEKLQYHEGEAIFTQELEGEPNGFVSGALEYQTCDDTKCLPAQKVKFAFSINDGVFTRIEENAMTALAQPTLTAFQYKHPTIDHNNPLTTCSISADEIKGKGNWTIFILGFIGGLLALLTPCVFPMIPLTVSFFTKSSEGKKGMFNAALYGFFILLVYMILSLPFHLLDSIDPNILNTISTNAWLNVAFFIVFVVFAISFFGYYEITLPSALANKADSASNVGGLIGIFFMSLTLALVSFSCTGPILGSLLAGSLTSDGGAWQLTAGMSGFGLALALPFTLFAAFPSWLNKLPKSGGWLSKVKVVLGFIELALAVKFLSNADLVEHWGILKYEVFMVLWILIALGLFIYLLGKIKFPHDGPFQKWTSVRGVMTVFALACVIYFSTGFRYSNETKTFKSLSLLSGLAPPAGYSIIHPNHCPLNLNCFHSYEEGLAYAKQTGKPIMLDFTGWACVNCRKMEENVWNQPEVFKIINENYVLISLYVDDREKLSLDKQHDYLTAQGKLKHIETVGDKWATFQTETFVNNSQPYYALLSNDEKLLVKPVGYTPSVSEFASYLTCGLEASSAAKK